MNIEEMNELAVKYQQEREHNFATVDPATCTHDLVYNKDGDNMHCHYCDKFMYDESKD